MFGVVCRRQHDRGVKNHTLQINELNDGAAFKRLAKTYDEHLRGLPPSGALFPLTARQRSATPIRSALLVLFHNSVQIRRYNIWVLHLAGIAMQFVFQGLQPGGCTRATYNTHT